MANKPGSLSFITILRTGDKETIETLEVYNPSITSLEPVRSMSLMAHDDEWRSGHQSDVVDICITGNIGIYEKVQKMVADCYLPYGPLPPSPASPPSQRWPMPAIAGMLTAGLLACALLASGLG
jgi:hypothetical protein